MAAINGTNILQGALMGALAGAVFGAAAGLPNASLVTITAGAIFGGAGSSLSGGDGLRGMIIGAAGAAIGYGVGVWGGSIAKEIGKFGQGVLAVMSGGTVGGLSSVAMGGDFWRGFTMGAVSAGLSFAGNLIAVEIESANYTVQGSPNEPDTSPINDGKRADLNPNEQAALDQIPMLDRTAKDVVGGNRELVVAQVPNAKGALKSFWSVSEKAAQGSFQKVYSDRLKALTKLSIKSFEDLMDKAQATGHYHRTLAPYTEPPTNGDATPTWVARAAEGKAVYVRDSKYVYFLRAGVDDTHSWIRIASPRTFNGIPY
jgi:hypothetical protein